jgi:hypothetical protein
MDGEAISRVEQACRLGVDGATRKQQTVKVARNERPGYYKPVTLGWPTSQVESVGMVIPRR